jgi:pyrroline-5-carboxylate reductase
MAEAFTLGIVGGTGALGGAIARAVLRRGVVAPDRLWVSNRTGRAKGLDPWPGARVTARNQDLAQHCDILLLAVPPDRAGALDLVASGRLVISVMAGVTVARLAEVTGARAIVRAMCSPAADLGLAYAPWYTPGGLTARDRASVTAIFTACGLTDEVPEEGQIDQFTAMTGPVPGFVAAFAKAMVDYAVARGIAPDVAERAIRQLFLASGRILSEGPETPAAHVQSMIDYAGTTAAGLTALRDAGLDRVVAAGLAAAASRARGMAR